MICLERSGRAHVEDVQGAVCKDCWVRVFNTEAIEAFWQWRIPEFEYKVSWQQIIQSAKYGCSWCSYLRTQLPGHNDPMWPSNWTPELELVLTIAEANIMDNAHPKGLRCHCEIDFGTADSSRDWHAEMEFFTDDEETSRWILAAPVQVDVDCSKSYQQIKTWLANCSAHPGCASVVETALPTRVLEIVEENSSSQVRILQTNGMKGEYLALSYCWGFQQPSILTTKNFNSLTKGVQVNLLSRTIRDAIKVTAKLGCRYLWVDALCIIQDSNQDKIQELALMDQIYQNSFLTIVAASAAAPTEGFLEPRSNSRQSFKLPFRLSQNEFASVHVQEFRPYSDQEEPVNKRAWTMQEQLLSPRLVIYASHTLQWRCYALTCNLGSSYHSPSLSTAPQLPLPLERIARTPSHFGVEDPLWSAFEVRTVWLKIVTAYSHRAASLSCDKLTALAGIAKYLHTVFRCKYFAGIWETSVLEQLCWKPGSSRAFLIRPTEYRAPSWSWASVDGPLYFDSYVPTFFSPYRSMFLGCKATPRSVSLPFGEVVDGYLKLNGVMRTGRFEVVDKKITWVVDPLDQHGNDNEPAPIFGTARGSSDTIEDNFDRLVHCLAICAMRGLGFDEVEGLMLDRDQYGVLRRIGRFVAERADFDHLRELDVTIL